MLVCPICQFENAESNKFCQQCGASLTHKSCAECGAAVAFDRPTCQNCGAKVATVWRAIVWGDADSWHRWQQRYSDRDCWYLDGEGRYQLLSLPTVPPTSAEVELSVFDTQPFRAPCALPDAAWFPEAARPYLTLAARSHSHSLPEVHAAWQQNGLAAILLADRTHLPLLVREWSQEEAIYFQRLYWLYEMLELWAVLETVGCRQSLFVPDNLRLNANRVLCLQRLYGEPEDASLTLKDLGLMWEEMWMRSGDTLTETTLALLSQLKSNAEGAVETVRSRLKAAIGPEPPPPPPPALSVNAELPDPEDEEATLVITDPDFDDDEDEPTLMLSATLSELESAGQTDIGRRRDHNEDTFEIWTQIDRYQTPSDRRIQARGLYVLCDGMGGHDGGEVASAMATNTLRAYFQDNWGDELPDEVTLREAVSRANRTIFDENQNDRRSGSRRMGTTLVMMLLHDTRVAVAHVGDSRLYRLTRSRGLEQITVDHEVGQREIRRGVAPNVAYNHPNAYQLTQALGPRDDRGVEPEVQFLDITEDTVFILASDGLTDNGVLESHDRTHLTPLLDFDTPLDREVERLIDVGNQYNGHDNITAVLVRVKMGSGEQ